MEIANLVKKDDIVSPVPTQVKRSSVPDPETTRGKRDKNTFRKRVESEMSEVDKEESKEVVEEQEQVFPKTDEPEIRGTIVITVYKNHPYDVEFSGQITGTERDLSIKFLMKSYVRWKAKIAKDQERALKIKREEEKKKEEANARN